MRREDRILLEENELKPNRYVANTMVFAMGISLLIELLNELRIFLVNPGPMRMSCGILLCCTIAIQILGRRERFASRSNIKYWILLLVYADTLVSMVVLYQWSELLLALALLLSIQYHDRRITKVALISSTVVAVVSPLLNILLGFAQLDYYLFLMESIGYKAEAVALNPDYDSLFFLRLVFFYISVPRWLLVGVMSPVAFYLTDLVSANLQSRIEAVHLSTTDMMTGVLNRFSYESKLNEYGEDCPERLICVYADADELHDINNQYGHVAGDALLKACAREMLSSFGEMTYRIGGDEFLSFIENGDIETVRREVEALSERLRKSGYHLSVGCNCLEEGKSIHEMVRQAENDMFRAKHEYYMQSGRDRRKRERNS